jgi:flagellar biosynthesis/type III secretory pathway protein FliH
MDRPLWTRAVTLVVAGVVLLPATAAAQSPRDRGRIVTQGWENAAQNAFERGLREGRRYGEDDGRRGRAFGLEVHVVYRSGDRGYQSRYGSREAYRGAFRRGFASGYRDGYDSFRARTQRPGRQRGYQEPAYARGFSDGYRRGVDDGRDGDRYDPVGHRDYREADQGYHSEYGSRDAYRNNYRAGFRPGYEEGYREGARSRR